MVKTFLESVWPQPGIYCLAIPQKFINEDGTQKSYFKHKVFTSIDEVIKTAEDLDRKGSDVFFTVGTLKAEKVYNEKKDKWQIRTHENIDRFNAFILDIDCGENKPYKNKGEGLNALKAFCVHSGMPFPTVVDSGSGLHIYWTFDNHQGTTADYWYNIASQFKKITEFYKLEADPSRTSDKSSVLRVPGTHNHKREIPEEVKILRVGKPTKLLDIVNIFEKIISENDIDILPELKKPSAFDGIESNLTTYPKANLASVFKKCKQMAYVKEVGGPVGYQMRASACSIIKQCDVVDYSMLWANDPNETVVKNQTFAMIEDSITDNPHTCERIESNNKGGCDGCKNAIGKSFKSPIVFGYPTAEADDIITQPTTTTQNIAPELDRTSIAPPLNLEMLSTSVKTITYDNTKTFLTHDGIVLPVPPYPYKRDAKGQIVCEPRDSDGALGDVVVIYEHEIYPYERIWDAHTNCEMVKLRAKLPQDGWREVYTELYTITDPKSFSKLMSIHGIIVSSIDRMQQLGTYMSSYIKYIQTLCKATENYPQLGWQKDTSVFVLPEHSYHDTGEVVECGVSAALKHAVSSFRKRGTFDAWKSVINTYGREGYEPYAFGHLVGYGSLLFQFTEHHGAIVNMVGESGSGKSTVLQTINSLFGHPDESMLTQIDTINAKMNRIGVFNSICTTYDEITNIDPEELSQFCYAVSQGRAKHRLGQDATEKENNTRWKMILASTSNANLMQKLSSLKQDASAESLRVFEYPININDAMTKAESMEIFSKLQDNFGHAGEVFVYEVVQKKEKVKALVLEMTNRFDRLANVPRKERYWSSIVGCTIAGGMIAKKLGLCDYDMDKLMNWAVVQIKNMRNVVEDNRRDPRALLVEFMNSIIGNTLVIGGGIEKDKGLYVREEARGQILARNEIDAGIMYLSKKAVRDWLTKGGTDINWVRKNLLQSKILIDENRDKVLTAGSTMAKTGQTRCWVIDLNHRDMAGVQLSVISKIGNGENQDKKLFDSGNVK